MGWIASIASELRVVGYNPECADIVNPRGEIVSEVFFILLTNAIGERLIGPDVSGPESKLVDAIQRGLDRNTLDPRKSAAYRSFYPVYGSPAYEAEDQTIMR